MRLVSCAMGLTAVLLLSCCGCGTSEATPAGNTVPVKGKVTYKGKPLTGGEVLFEPVNGGREAHGNIQADGTFTLSTFEPGDGAVRGPHRVAVTGSVPQKYRSLGSSGVEIEVKEDQADYTIDLK